MLYDREYVHCAPELFFQCSFKQTYVMYKIIFTHKLHKRMSYHTSSCYVFNAKKVCQQEQNINHK